MTEFAARIADMAPLAMFRLLAQAENQPGGIEQIFANPLIPLVMLGVLFYFMVLRPDAQRKAEHAKLLDALKKHDRVVTIGGIHATVSNVQKDSGEITLVIDENTNTKIRVQRSSISRVLNGKEDAKEVTK